MCFCNSQKKKKSNGLNFCPDCVKLYCVPVNQQNAFAFNLIFDNIRHFLLSTKYSAHGLLGHVLRSKYAHHPLLPLLSPSGDSASRPRDIKFK